MKIFSTLFTVLTVIALAIGLATFDAKAALQSQIDSTALPISTTTTYALNGDVTGNYTNGTVIAGPNTFIDTTHTSRSSFSCGGYFANTSASSSNVTFLIYGSNDAHLWSSVTNMTLIIPATSTNYCWTNFDLPPLPNFAMRAVTNANSTVSAPAGSLFFKATIKTGI